MKHGDLIESQWPERKDGHIYNFGNLRWEASARVIGTVKEKCKVKLGHR